MSGDLSLRVDPDGRVRAVEAVKPDLFEVERVGFHSRDQNFALRGAVGRAATSGGVVDLVVADLAQLDGALAQELVDWDGVDHVSIRWLGRDGLQVVAEDAGGREYHYRGRLLA